MTQIDTYERAARTISLTNGYSPLLRDKLLSDPKVIDQNEVEADLTISFGFDDLTFQSSLLFPAVIIAFDRVSTPQVKSIDGHEWTVEIVGEVNLPNVMLLHKEQRFHVTQLTLLATEAEARLNFFQQMVDQYCVSVDVADYWRTLLSERVPTTHEMMTLTDVLQNTPLSVIRHIQEELKNGHLTLKTLVPHSEAYYHQLVGGGGNASALNEYITTATELFIDELHERGNPQALNFAWALCSHQSISQLIEQKWHADNQILTDSMVWLVNNGDPISLAGAVEVALHRAEEKPTLPLAELINALLDEKSDGETDAFALLAGLFNCIYGQMAKCRILTTWPIFARRLAALTHASLICRHLRTADQNKIDLIQWLSNANVNFFKMQSLIDMRVGPRWFPHLSSAEQWRNELLGRACLAARLAPDAIKNLGCVDKLIGEGAESVIHKYDSLAMQLPGPLEGETRVRDELPPDVIIQIEERLKGAIDITSFHQLISVSLFAPLSEHLIDLAIEALERCHFQIPMAGQGSATKCLFGLALVAAIGRHTKLYDAIQTSLRVSRHLKAEPITVDTMFQIGVIACAAHIELMDWTEQIGQFMFELAMLDSLAKEDAESLQSNLAIMCHIVPELWGTCGHAQAALGLVIGK